MLTLALLTTLAAAQPDMPSEHLQQLQPLIGQWVCVGSAQSDSPGIGPKGTEFIAVATYAWAINKNALQINFVAKSADRKPVQVVELIGWDAGQKTLVSQAFGSGGHVEHNVWSCENGVVICETKGVDVEGKEVALKYLHTFEGDTMTMRMAGLTVDGKTQPEESYKYRRVR